MRNILIYWTKNEVILIYQEHTSDLKQYYNITILQWKTRTWMISHAIKNEDIWVQQQQQQQQLRKYSIIPIWTAQMTGWRHFPSIITGGLWILRYIISFWFANYYKWCTI